MIYSNTMNGGTLCGGREQDFQIYPCPGGLLTEAVDALRDLISSSATFQAAVGANNQPTAKQRVYVMMRSATGNLPFTPPFALVTIPPNAIGTKIESGPWNSGQLEWMLFIPTPETYADDPTNVFNWSAGIAEGLVLDIWN